MKKNLPIASIAALLLCVGANAETILYTGTFDAEDLDYAGPETAISGTWTATVDDSDFLSISGVGFEVVSGSVTSITMSPSPLGTTVFEVSNTGFQIGVCDGIPCNMTVGGLIDGVGGVGGADDWFANYFPGTVFSPNGAPLDGQAAEATWTVSTVDDFASDPNHGGTFSVIETGGSVEIDFSGINVLGAAEYVNGQPVPPEDWEFAPFFATVTVIQGTVRYDANAPDTDPDPDTVTLFGDSVGSLLIELPELGFAVDHSTGQVSAFNNATGGTSDQFFVGSTSCGSPPDCNSYVSNTGVPEPAGFSLLLTGDPTMLDAGVLPTQPLDAFVGNASFIFQASDGTSRQVLLVFEPVLNEPVSIEVPADECTVTAGGCNPTGGHEIVLPDGFVPPPGATITQTPFPFVDPRVDANGRCDGQSSLELFDGSLVLPPYICGSPEFEVLVTEANFDILEGTVISTMFPEVFVNNPLDCNRPIVGDPQAQDIVVWQPTDKADVSEGHAIETTYDCGSSRGRTRGFSFYVVGTHIDFGLNFAQDPQGVTQAFIDLTSRKLDALVVAIRNAEAALPNGEFSRAEAVALQVARLHGNGNYTAASRMLGTLRMLIERSMFDASVGFNHEGNIISRLDNIKFTLDEKIIPFAN